MLGPYHTRSNHNEMCRGPILIPPKHLDRLTGLVGTLIDDTIMNGDMIFENISSANEKGFQSKKKSYGILNVCFN